MRKFSLRKRSLPENAAQERPAVFADAGRRDRLGDIPEDPRRIIQQGLGIIVFFFGILGLWAALCRISGAIVAPGTVKIESERKTVQHLEGGIVEAILAREGEAVKEGQTLVLLESVQIEASEHMLEKMLVAHLASRERFAVEKERRTELHWSDALRRMAEDSGSEDVLDNEEKLFRARGEALRGQISLLGAQIAQIDAQIVGYREQIKAEQTIIRTLNEELRAKRQLWKERYLEKSQILELERSLAGHEGNRGRLMSSIAEAGQKDLELRLRITDAENRFVEDAVAQVARLDNEIIQTRERIRPLRDARKRLRVTAPVSGRVVDLKVHSRGGVVRAGEALMDIVPEDNPLIVETRVPVNKITEVYPGQEALVQLDAFDTRVTEHIPAKVVYVSADRLEEPTGAGVMPYYLTWVAIDTQALQKADMYISPGMPATVFITTRERTVLYYMFESLLKGWERALRE
jgi:HlyD family secretion protein/epimerase transport system membrane fusion protein